MKKAIISLILTVISLGIYSQHDHSSHGGTSHAAKQEQQAPHGGELKKTGKYQIEMVVKPILKENQLSFYLLKSNLKPIPNQGIIGTITIEYADGTTESQDLKAESDDFFVAQLKHTEAFQCTVKFKVKDETVSTFFSYKNTQKNHSHY